MMEKDIIQKEIEKARDTGCFLAELALALTIPSVCGRYGLTDEELSNQRESVRYPAWYDQYVYPQYQLLTGRECYAIRCALLHNGDVDIYKQSIMRNERKENSYRLIIPEYGDHFCLKYEENSQLYDRPFCAAGLAINLLDGYEKFKEQNPEFKYPLDSYTPENQ